MEAVSLSLGIIPLIIKLYRSSRSRFKVFRHYSREVGRVEKQFDRQRLFFLNEIHFTLRLVIDDESLLRDMVGNGDHPQWQSPSLERAMLDHFNANNCQALKEITAEIGETINAVQEGLECFKELKESRLEVRPLGLKPP